MIQDVSKVWEANDCQKWGYYGGAWPPVQSNMWGEVYCWICSVCMTKKYNSGVSREKMPLPSQSPGDSPS